MTTFDIGYWVTHRRYKFAGEGVITGINGNGIEAIWSGVDRETPYKAIDKKEDLILLVKTYSSDQSGDTDEDI